MVGINGGGGLSLDGEVKLYIKKGTWKKPLDLACMEER